MITLEEIKQAILDSQDVVFNVNSSYACPAAIAGKIKYGQSFTMCNFNRGVYKKDAENFPIVLVDKSWSDFTFDLVTFEKQSICSKQFLLDKIDELISQR